MARQDYSPWIGVEKGSEPIQALARASAMETHARSEPMAGDTKQVPRSGNFAIAAVAKGAAYTETSDPQSYVELIARKAGGVRRIAEEDFTDVKTARSIIDITKVDASRNLAKFFDNATIGTTAAANGTTILYTSVYNALATADATTGYTAGANLNTIARSATTAAMYVMLSDTFALYEESEWFDESDTIVIASPSLKTIVRNMLGSDDRPVFAESVNGGSDRLFGHNIAWSMGARTSAVNTQSPTGNPLVMIANKDLLINGKAKLTPQIADGNPGFKIQRADQGSGFMTDEALMKAAMRRGFAVGNQHGMAMLEITPAI